MADYAAPWAVSAVKQGLSANEGYRRSVAAGAGVRRATFLRLYAEARTALAGTLDEASRPLDARPHGAEIFPMSTQTATGYIQHGIVFLRNRETGEVSSQYRSVTVDFLDTRANILATIEDKARAETRTNGTLDGEVVLGSAYIGTYIMVPGKGT